MTNEPEIDIHSPLPVQAAAQPAQHKGTFGRWAALLVPAGFILLADQVSKALVLRNISLGEVITPIPALSEVFGITFSQNRGAAFSMLPQLGDVFLIVAVIMVVGIVAFYRRVPPGHWPERIALGLLLGGACGNALDRLQHGFVVDWFLVRLPGVVTNVSNFADHAIVIGVAVVFFLSVFNFQPKRPVTEP